jgi:hypothetical protein
VKVVTNGNPFQYTQSLLKGNEQIGEGLRFRNGRAVGEAEGQNKRAAHFRGRLFLPSKPDYLILVSL